MHRFGFTAVLTWESIIPLTLPTVQAGVAWVTSQPPLQHQMNRNICGGAVAGMKPRPNILGYHCAVYQTTENKTIYTLLSVS